MDSLYHEEILDHYRNPHRKGTLDAPSSMAEATNPLCGDEIRFELRVVDRTIVDVAWSGHGCAISQAAASMLADELVGMGVDEVVAYPKDEVLELIGVPLTPVRLKCGLLAWSVAVSAADGDPQAHERR